jgi:hypothetical protein
MYEHGETWLNYVDRGNFRSPMLSGSLTSRDIWQQAGGTGEGNDEFGLCTVFFFTLASNFYMLYCDMGPPALLPLRRKACCGFYRP